MTDKFIDDAEPIEMCCFCENAIHSGGVKCNMCGLDFCEGCLPYHKEDCIDLETDDVPPEILKEIMDDVDDYD